MIMIFSFSILFILIIEIRPFLNFTHNYYNGDFT